MGRMKDLFDDQADPNIARGLRDLALEKVSINSGSWMDQALRAIALHMHGEFTGEKMRLELVKIIGPPHHHNAWGALTNQAIRKKLIHKTGRYENMVTKKSHARATQILRKS